MMKLPKRKTRSSSIDNAFEKNGSGHATVKDESNSFSHDEDYIPETLRRTQEEMKCVRYLKTVCKVNEIRFSMEELFRFAHYHNFDVNAAKYAVRQHKDSEFLRLKMAGSLVRQFETMTLFPLPGMKTKDGKREVFYMRPSRYFPGRTPTSAIIDNLCYVMNDLSKTESQCRNGVAFIANMNGWTMKNFSRDYCYQFMQALQGGCVPTKVELFLILNPPAGFNKIWKIMKPMLSASFVKKVSIVNRDRLPQFLMDGYEIFLPNDIEGGWKDTLELVEDYIDLKLFQDRERSESQGHLAL